MPRTDSQETADNDVENLFIQEMYPLISEVVGQACADLGHYPGQAESDDFIQETGKLLIENSYGVLRLFDRRSSPATYLYTIAYRHILHRLQKEGMMQSLDDLPPDFFTVQPGLEERLLIKELRAIVLSVSDQLTRHQQRLLNLLQQDRSIEEIAKELGIKKRSVSMEIGSLKRKLQRIIRAGLGFDPAENKI